MKANVRIEQTNILCECSVVGETDSVLPDIRNEQTNILCECSLEWWDAMKTNLRIEQTTMTHAHVVRY